MDYPCEKGDTERQDFDHIISECLQSILDGSIVEGFDPNVFDDLCGSCDTTTDVTPDISDKRKRSKRKDVGESKKRGRKRPKQVNVGGESLLMPNISPEGAFHLSSKLFQNGLSFSNSPLFLPSSGGSTLQIIQTTSPLKPPLIGMYVLVSPQILSPCAQINPLSPVDGTVAPPELSAFRLPVGSSSDSAFTALTARSVIISSPVKISDETLQKNIVSTAPKLGRKVCHEAPKCVKNYIHQLKSLLRDVCSSMREQLRMESHYVDTQLVQRELHIKSGKNANKCLEKELNILSDSERKHAKSDRRLLFHKNGSSPKQSIAVFGKAGLGKTTLIQRFCLDWADGSLPQFNFVFIINCKNLDFKQTNFSLKALLLNLSVSPHCEDSEAVFKQILSYPDEVLLIFDSFEYMKDFEGLLQSPAKSPTDAKYTLKQLFSGLFLKELLSGCTLLIATRPRDVLNQVLRKMDCLFEIDGFSSEDIELYTSKYFNHCDSQESALQQIKNQGYLFSLCANPLLCWSTCFLLKHQETHSESLPSTLTSLYQRVTSKHLELASYENGSLCKRKPPDISQLYGTAWEGLKEQSTLLNPDMSKELLEYGEKSGICALEQQAIHFTDLFTQSLLSAVHLIQSKQVSEKMMVAKTLILDKKRKLHGESQDVLQRFVMGLIFQKGEDGGSPLDFSVKSSKRKAVETHLESLNPSDLVSARLLELFHCVYETRSEKFAMLLLERLPENLSFCGVHLCSSDVYVICHLLQQANTIKRSFSINLQDTDIPISGLKELVGLRCIRSFWAHTADTIDLWEELHRSNNELDLKCAIDKFTLNPLQLKQEYHIKRLPVLVKLHREKKFTTSEFVPALCDGVPAIQHLHKLEFEIGTQNGPELFPRLIEVLPSLQALKHLDLEKNHIGDYGAEKLSGVLYCLVHLKLLNLAQNRIGDAGVEKLAKALSTVSCLQTLSLYGNAIADSGAEHLALVLPEIKSLQDLDVKYNKFTDIGAKTLSAALKKSPGMKSLGLWNDCIPYGVYEHLHLQDPRIRSL